MAGIQKQGVAGTKRRIGTQINKGRRKNCDNRRSGIHMAGAPQVQVYGENPGRIKYMMSRCIAGNVQNSALKLVMPKE